MAITITASGTHALWESSNVEAPRVSLTEHTVPQSLGDHAIATHLRYNNSLPVSAIPPEVVLLLFQFHRANHPAWSLDWIGLSHVFHYWRAVALGCSSLWTDIPVHGRKLGLVYEWLTRARNHPLNVWTEIYCAQSENECMVTERLFAYNSIMERSSSIRDLEIVLPEDNMNLLTFPDSTLDRLETLRLAVSDSTSLSPFRHQQVLTSTRFPNLTSLSLVNVREFWRPGMFPHSLRRLELRRSLDRFSLQESGTLLTVLATLERLTLLEELVLDNVLSFATSPSSSAEIVRLPNLQHLRIETFARYLIPFLDHVVVPASARLRLHCRNYVHDPTVFDIRNSLSYMFQGVRHYENQPLSIPIQSCLLRFNDDIASPSFTITCWASDAQSEPDYHIQWSATGVFIPFTWYGNRLELPALCRSMNLENITKLYIEGWPYDELELSKRWMEQLCSMTQNVRHLHVLARNSPDLIRLLPQILSFRMLGNSDHEREEYGRVSFPGLETLQIEGFNDEDLQTFSGLLWNALRHRRVPRRTAVLVEFMECYGVPLASLRVVSTS